MNIPEYLESGILESYCMGLLTGEEQCDVEMNCLLYPEIQAEFLAVQQTMELFAKANALSPRPAVKDRILSTIHDIEKEAAMDLSDLPLISKYSDHQKWLNAVMALIPGNPGEETFMHPLRQSGGVTQVLVVTSSDVPDETHENIRESFLILKGDCECTVSEATVGLSDGGFIEIPLYENHDVKVLSPYVVAILQHVEI